ncbi:lysophospholipid acyltransferase family protein [Pelagibacteraceae bacterium]|nr:lysophospholipid acyltransferase family protein [Pelagibacteraceae bacterium]
MLKVINYFFQSIIIYLFFLIGKILGIKISRKLFSFLFLLAGPTFKSKNIIINNLNIFLKKQPALNKEKIILDMWKNYGKTFIEYVFLNDLRNNESSFTVTGETNLLEATQKNKPVIFISGHFANFEMMSMVISKKKIPLAIIYRPLNNIFLNPFMEFLRKKYICSHQVKKGINGVREAIDFIKKKHSIALMIDQRVSEGEKINFFDEKALTTTFPAQLSNKFNLDIIPVFIERDENDNFKIEFQKPIKAKAFKNKLELTKELNRVLEKMIIRNPGQWIWTHNRWKQ